MSWQRLINGLIIIIVGAILLANTNGYLPWSVWNAAMHFWPLLIVGMGVQVAFSKWKIPGLALSIIIILVLAAANPNHGYYYRYDLDYQYRFPLFHSTQQKIKELSIPLETTDSVLEMVISAPSVTVEARGEPVLNLDTNLMVLTGELMWDRIEPAVDWRRIGDNKVWAQIKTLTMTGNAGKQEWNFLMNPSLQTDMTVTGGVSNLKLDCTSIYLKSLVVSTGVTRLNLIMGLSGGNSTIEVSGGVANIDVIVPKKAGIKISVSGPPLVVNSDFSDQGLIKQGNYWITPDFDEALTKIDLSVSCGVGKINLDRSSSW